MDHSLRHRIGVGELMSWEEEEVGEYVDEPDDNVGGVWLVSAVVLSLECEDVEDDVSIMIGKSSKSQK